MNTYLINSKVRLLKQAREDFLSLYGINYTPFTRKLHFYFFIYDNKKYVHKESLKFVYSNADTYTKDPDPYYCNIQKDFVPLDPFPFLECYKGNLIPTLLENNDKFLVYDFFEGEPVDFVTLEEFNWLKSEHENNYLTPFYNSMTYNIVRNVSSVKLVDLKHFEVKDSKPFFLYLYNEQNSVNTLYIEKGTDTGPINSHLGIDYPVKDANIIEY